MTYMATWLDRFTSMKSHAIRVAPEDLERTIYGWCATHIKSGGSIEHGYGMINLLDETQHVVGMIAIWHSQASKRAMITLGNAVLQTRVIKIDIDDTCLSCYERRAYGTSYCERHALALDADDEQEKTELTGWRE